jgi:MipA family protein
MNKSKLKYGTIGLAALLLAPVVHAEIAVPVEGLDVNIIGIAVASVPDYWGSAENEGAVGLYGRYQFQDSQRYVQLLGPELTVNLLDDSNWRLGPIIRYRSARDSDVDDKVVSEMDEVDDAVEGGVFLSYKLPLSAEPLHQINFSGDIESGKNGTEGHLKVTYFQPFSKTIIGNIGLGMTYGDDEFMENYFGVTSANDKALFGGKAYDASSGVAAWNIPFGVSAFLTPEWLLSVGGRYERLMSDAKDSPVVDDRGDANQWIGGVGIAYVFK